MTDPTPPQAAGMAAELREYMEANPIEPTAADEVDEGDVTGTERAEAVVKAAAQLGKSKAARLQRNAEVRASMDASGQVYERYRAERMAEGAPQAGAGVALSELVRDHVGEQVPECPDDDLTAWCLAWLADCGERGESSQVMARKFGVTLREVSDRMTRVARSVDLVEKIGHDEKGHAWWRAVNQEAEQAAAVEEAATERAETGDEVGADAAAVLELLAESGSDGASSSQLAGALGWKSHNVRRRLLALESAGQAVRTGQRKTTTWYAAEHAPTSEDPEPARV